MTHVVYAHIGRDDQVLYVGTSGRLGERLADHRRGAAWWSQIEGVEIAGIGPWREMCDLERRLIETFDPPHNVVYTSAWRAAQRALYPAVAAPQAPRRVALHPPRHAAVPPTYVDEKRFQAFVNAGVDRAKARYLARTRPGTR